MELYLCSPIRLHDMDRDNCTFTIYGKFHNEIATFSLTERSKRWTVSLAKAVAALPTKADLAVLPPSASIRDSIEDRFIVSQHILTARTQNDRITFHACLKEIVVSKSLTT